MVGRLRISPFFVNNLDPTNVNITGGSINGTVIGDIDPREGTFTKVNTSSVEAATGVFDVIAAEGIQLSQGANDGGYYLSSDNRLWAVMNRPSTGNNFVIRDMTAPADRLTISTTGLATFGGAVNTGGNVTATATNARFEATDSNVDMWMMAFGTGVGLVGTISNHPVQIYSNNTPAGQISTDKSWSLGGLPGSESLRVVPAANAVNRGEVFGAATSGSVRLYTNGTDTDIPWDIGTKGAGPIVFNPGSATQALISYTAASVNFLNMTGGASGTGPSVRSSADRLNLGTSDGNGVQITTDGSYSNVQALFTHTASADRFLTLTGSNGGDPTIGTSAGNMLLDPAGTPTLQLVSVAGSNRRIQVVGSNGSNPAITTSAGNLQLSAANGVISTAGNGRIVSTRVVTAAGAISVNNVDYLIAVNKTVGAATVVNLPAGPTSGQTFIIKDKKGDAATNNITITPAAGNIDGAGTFIMNMNRQSVTVIYDGTEWSVN